MKIAHQRRLPMMDAEPPVEYFPKASSSTTTTSEETISISGDFEFDMEGNFVVADNTNSPSPVVEKDAKEDDDQWDDDDSDPTPQQQQPPKGPTNKRNYVPRNRKLKTFKPLQKRPEIMKRHELQHSTLLLQYKLNKKKFENQNGQNHILIDLKNLLTEQNVLKKEEIAMQKSQWQQDYALRVRQLELDEKKLKLKQEEAQRNRFVHCWLMDQKQKKAVDVDIIEPTKK